MAMLYCPYCDARPEDMEPEADTLEKLEEVLHKHVHVDHLEYEEDFLQSYCMYESPYDPTPMREFARRIEYENDQPDEGDYTVTPCGWLGTRLLVGRVGAGPSYPSLGEFSGDNQERDVDNAVRRQMDKEQFFPNVWDVSDHGNWSTRDLSGPNDDDFTEGDSCPTCGAALAPSVNYPWHYWSEDCRAIHRIPREIQELDDLPVDFPDGEED